MTFNHGGGLWVLLHEVSQVLDIAIAFFFNAGFVEVELNVQLNANQFHRLFSSNWLRSRFNSSNNNRSRLAAATEVHADTDAWRPLGVALVDVVLSFNASTGIEVVSEVVLGTAADVGEGRTVTTIATGLTNALIRETCRNVRTQCVASVVEVIQSIQSSVRTLDVAAIFATGVVHFVVSQAQFNVVSQVVADATAEQIAVVFEVTGAIEHFFLSKPLHFDSALTLSQSA